MACQICGARCMCKKRGPSGLCCGCHRHKPRPIREAYRDVWPEFLDDDERKSLLRHRAAIDSAKQEKLA
jgi:hypothetical protein